MVDTSGACRAVVKPHCCWIGLRSSFTNFTFHRRSVDLFLKFNKCLMSVHLWLVTPSKWHQNVLISFRRFKIFVRCDSRFVFLGVQCWTPYCWSDRFRWTTWLLLLKVNGFLKICKVIVGTRQHKERTRMNGTIRTTTAGQLYKIIKTNKISVVILNLDYLFSGCCSQLSDVNIEVW